MAVKLLMHPNNDSLVCEGGDVIIRTSNKASEIFVMHKDVLTSKSSYLAGLLSDRWTTPTETVDKEGYSSLDKFEVDLYLDHDTRLALLTRELGRLQRSVPSVTIHDLYLSPTDLQQNTFVFKTWDNSAAAAPQFAWSEPRPHHFSILEPRNNETKYDYQGIGTTYLRYFNVYHKTAPWLGKMHVRGEVTTKETARLPDRRYESEHLPSLVPNHEDTVQYVRTILQVLLSAMYGRSPAFHPDAPSYVLVLLVANLLEYADYLMLDDTVKSLLQHSIADIPGIWSSVKDNLRGFLPLGYMFRVPSLYLDAAHHLIGKTTPRQFELHAVHGVSTGLNTDTLELLRSGSKALQERVIKLSRELIATVTLRHDSDAIRYSYSLGHMNDGGLSFSGKRGLDVAKALSSVLAPSVLDVAYALLLDTDRNGSFNLLCGPGQAAFRKLKNLYKSMSEQSDSDLDCEFSLRQLALNSGFYVPKLRANMKSYMSSIRYRIQFSGLLESAEHEFSANRWQEDIPLGCPIHSAHCARCFRARCETDAYFTFFNTRHFSPVSLETPWPMRDVGGPCTHHKQTFLAEIKTTPASLEWLSKIGVGNKFKHLEARDTRKRSHLTIDTETKGYFQESMHLTFDSNDTLSDSNHQNEDDEDRASSLTPYPPPNPTQDPDPLAFKFDISNLGSLYEATNKRFRCDNVLAQANKDTPCKCKDTDVAMRSIIEERRRLRQQRQTLAT